MALSWRDVDLPGATLARVEPGFYVEPSITTVAEYLRKWLTHAVQKVNPKTHERYTQLVANNLVPLIGEVLPRTPLFI